MGKQASSERLDRRTYEQELARLQVELVHMLESVRAEGTRRLYSVDAGGLREVDGWLAPFRHFWEQRLDALGTEIARGKRARREAES